MQGKTKGDKMAILNILKNEDPTLRKTCRLVDEVTPRIRTLLDDMAETMRAAGGVGLAGPQVGVLRRVVVIETDRACQSGNYPPLRGEAGGLRGLPFSARKMGCYSPSDDGDGSCSGPQRKSL